MNPLAVVATGMLGLLAQTSAPTAQTAPRVTMFKLVAMLILLVLGGVALVVWAWLTLCVGRRQVRRAAPSAARAKGAVVTPDDWARKALIPNNPTEAVERDADEPGQTDEE